MIDQIKDAAQSIVRLVLDYDADTGVLRWRAREMTMFSSTHRCKVWNSQHAGKEAGSINSQGYLDVRLDGKLHRAHRLAWIHVNGALNGLQVDHINGVKTDNRLINLRAVSQLENGRNQRLGTNNTSGVNGVCWDKQHKKWRAQIGVKGRRVLIGVFADMQEAIVARLRVERQFGFHQNHGAPKNAASE